MSRKTPRWIGATITGIAASGAIAATASAHVHVDVEGEAIAGQPAQLVFEVPNERTDAATTTIQVQMPSEADLTDVVPAEVEGWAITTTTRPGTTVEGEVIDTIRWDATGPGLAGEDTATLPVAVGPLPAVEILTFPTTQTYDDGDVVRWIEPAPAGEPEPDLPVPTMAITAAVPADTTTPTAPEPTAAAASVATPASEPTTPPTETAVIVAAPSDTADDVAPGVTAPPTTVDVDGDDDDSPVWPLVVGAIVLVVVAGAAIAITRRRTSP